MSAVIRTEWLTQPEEDNYFVPVAGVELIKQFESCCALEQGQPDERGHLEQKQTGVLLLQQLKQRILPELVAVPGWYELNENQQGALISYVYSLSDELLLRFSELPMADAIRQRRWYLVPGILQKHLGTCLEDCMVRRRQAEADLFLLAVQEDAFTLINRSRPLALCDPPLEGQDVYDLQRVLVRDRFEIAVDGWFGPMTQWAVEKYQAAVGLPVTGIADARTQKILYARALCLEEPYLIGSDVKEVQTLLVRVGYDIEADGIFGLRTREAAIAFQTFYGLPEDGIIHEKTLALLLNLPIQTEAA